MLNQQGLRRIPAVEGQNNPGLKYSRTEGALLRRVLLSQNADPTEDMLTDEDGEKPTDEEGAHKPTLMNLPVEIHEQILEHLLVAADGHIRPSQSGNFRLSQRGNLAITPAGQTHQLRHFQYRRFTKVGNLSPTTARLGLRIDLYPPVLATCRQMYHEGWPLLYHRNTLEFWTLEEARNFLKPGVALRAWEVRHVAIRCDYDYATSVDDDAQIFRSLSSKAAAELICSFAKLDTVEVQYDEELLECNKYDLAIILEESRDQPREAQDSEPTEISRRDAIARKPTLEYLKLSWIGDDDSTDNTFSLVLENRLWKKIKARLISLEEPVRALGLI